MNRKGRLWIFGLYCGVMLWVLLGRYPERPENLDQYLRLHINLQPMATFWRYFRLFLGNFSLFWRAVALVNLLGNVVLFVPFGYMTSSLFRPFRPLWRCLLLSAGLLIALEITQLLTFTGTLDIDDLLLNLTGITIGYALNRQKIPP